MKLGEIGSMDSPGNRLKLRTARWFYGTNGRLSVSIFWDQFLVGGSWFQGGNCPPRPCSSLNYMGSMISPTQVMIGMIMVYRVCEPRNNFAILSWSDAQFNSRSYNHRLPRGTWMHHKAIAAFIRLKSCSDERKNVSLALVRFRWREKYMQRIHKYIWCAHAESFVPIDVYICIYSWNNTFSLTY